MISPLAQSLIAAMVISVVLPRIKFGRYLLYPFALLGTWAHETGHGLAAILVGGNFKSLELYSNLGGVAYSTGTGNRKTAFVAAGGLIGPALIGGLVILFSAREELAPWILLAIAICVAFTTIRWIRNRFGFAAMTAIAIALVGATVYAPVNINVFLGQLIGIQFSVACWNTLDYMFTKHFYNKGHLTNSDTQDMAESIGLTYWFWGSLITVINAGLLGLSFYIAWLN